MREKLRIATLLSALIALSGCFDDKSSNDVPGGSPPRPLNQAPSIAGAPPIEVLEGESYEFTPVASDPDGDRLEFSIARKPAWASFDPETGRLSGTPDVVDVGNYTNITISVSDGQLDSNLGAFDVSVYQTAPGSVTLSWFPPTENADGTALTDLSGYRIYYGRNPNTLQRTLVLENPGLTNYVVENLTPAIWYFAMTSVNSDGVESSRSDMVSKPIG